LAPACAIDSRDSIARRTPAAWEGLMTRSGLQGRARRALRLTSLAVVGIVALAATGCGQPIERVWQYQSFSASGSSPAVAGDLIVFGTESGEVHAVTKGGAFRWKFQTRKEVISAPAVVDGKILFGSTNHNFYAVDGQGRQVWKYTTYSRIKGDPLVVDGEVFFGSYDKHLYALDVADRNVEWIYPMDSQANTLLGLEGGAEGSPEASALSGETPPPAEEGAEPKPEGEALAAAEPAAPTVDNSKWPADAFSYARPTHTSNDLIVAGNLDGHVYAIERKSGKLAWRFATDGAKDNLGVTSTVLEQDGVLYFGANDGNVYAIKLDDQSVVWKHKTEGEVNSSPIIDERGVLYVGSRDTKLYALDAKSGSEKWTMPAEGPILSAPALYKDLVIFGAGEGDGHVYAVDRRDGSVYWKYKTGGAVDADALVDGDRFYIASADKNLYAFQIKKLP